MIYAQSDLQNLIRTNTVHDMFGPGTSQPALFFRIERELDAHSQACLSRLPCPVIGIGPVENSNVCDVILPDSSDVDRLAKNIASAPIAAMVLVQLLRVSEALSPQHALTSESLAYGTLQKGTEFNAWYKEQQQPHMHSSNTSPLLAERKGNTVLLTLNAPQDYNAINIELRDALCEALDMALIDTTVDRVILTGNGKTFSIGGDVNEFGTVSDPATAHWIRSIRLPARKLTDLSQKLHAHINGAAIGAGIEMAAFAHTISASPKAWFQLPELKYGLIPGAGGTVSLPRRIGRHRTAYMALSMKRVSAQTALDWGLIDTIKMPERDI